MPETRAEVRMLGDSYAREMRSLLYHAYRHEPTFAYLLESDRPGFDQRVRATIRELTHQHMLEQLPVLGLVIDERLVAVALIAPPQRRLGITESWAWRMRMLLTTGFRCTKRYLEYHEAVLGCLPPGPYHVLPLIGVHPEFQGKHLGEQLLEALHAWCAEDGGSQGLVLDTGNARYLDFYRRHGYEEVGEVALGPIREHVLFHANPQTEAQLSRQGMGL
ncbi:GNAT family N-acetyltransferase [Pseudomonas sp. QL9]|uniref:N-acetyltransferase n=1 Tax=Pseudomonas knackmussii (strain DSM 6978 / CCUG 54928 / LMG 23759 / B13) TaxID=1301098 RepID=A0A024HHU8_PSEKB|nr:GNAT family N-acetyltransferase [Pseudomonas knackmussii]CDF84471.1 N-acetyltransferase [Pseudomonas knackmussii B13]